MNNNELVLDELDVVMPSYNEGDHVASALAALEVASERAGIRARLIVVDDGSGPADAAVLDELAATDRITLLRQINRGRFVARATGMAEARTDYVLLLDARVKIDPDSLARIAESLADGKNVWNYDVRLANPQSPWAGFWSAITCIWWRDYYADKRPVLIDEENFDRYPKGTGAFFAPRAALLEAMAGFHSSFADIRLASDDTKLLRHLAGAGGISLSPQVGCSYYGKDSAAKFAKQCLHRGSTFVDGYLGDPGRALPLLAGLGAGVGVGVLGLVRAPRLMLGLAAAGSLGAAGVSLRCGARPVEAAAVAGLAVPFGVFFGAGVVRGLVLAGRTQ